MSPLLFQKLIKTLCLFLLTLTVVVHSSIFDHIDTIYDTLDQLEAQAAKERTTTPTMTTTTTAVGEYYGDNGGGQSSNGTIMLIPSSVVGQSFNNDEQPASDDQINVVTITSRNPQPFTILMNFQNDGTMSLQIFNQDQTSWTDQGRCRYGQMYDPVSNVCRDVFCAQGYVLRPQGCVEDDNFNSTYDEPIKPPPDEMRVEVTLKHSLCVFSDREYNDECNTHRRVLVPSDSLLEAFRKSFVKLLEVDDQRVTNMTFRSYYVVNESSVIFYDSKTESWLNYSDITEFDLAFSKEEQARMKYVIKFEMKELLTFHFDIKDMKEFPGETRETIVLFYQLTLYTLDKRYFNVGPGHKAFITDVDEVKQQTDENGWCEDPGDKKEYSRSDFKVLASFEDIRPVYFVYLPENNALYHTGYYYFTVVYKRTPPPVVTTNTMITNNSLSTSTTTDIDFSTTTEEYNDTSLEFDLKSINRRGDSRTTSALLLLSLIDVTDIVIEQNATNTISSKILFVCNRNPRITIQCINHETMRLSLCELDHMIDDSYCMHKTGHCFFVDEYERDPIEPEKYIRVCKFYRNKDNSTVSNLFLAGGNSGEIDLNVAISGWISFIFTCISIISMIFCLATFALFRELRNIPGWNIINLTIALTIAQLAFLLGSFVNGTNIFCFIIAMATHYGFLASFFWMNVIAFDLHRNFRKKASHVLLQTLTVKDRLPAYALYAWLAPLLLVLTALTVDLVNKQAFNLTPFRPCYAGYLEGCNRIKSDLSTLIPMFNLTNATISQELSQEVLENAFFKNTSSIVKTHAASENESFASECEQWASQNEPHYVIVMGGSCWIRNGSANLLFFGLPIAIIIVINAIYYFLTIYNIRQKKRAQKHNNLRRFSRVKLPGDEDVKFYIQMAVIMGFTWIVGFFLTTVNWSTDNKFYIIYIVLTYVFIFLNASNGVLILFAFLFKKQVKSLYKKLFDEKWNRRSGRVEPSKSPISSTNSVMTNASNSRKVVLVDCANVKSTRIRENSQSSTSQLCLAGSTGSVNSSIKEKPRLDSLNEENEMVVEPVFNDVFLKI